MLEMFQPDLVAVFPGNEGTTDMWVRCCIAGYRTHHYDPATGVALMSLNRLK